MVSEAVAFHAKARKLWLIVKLVVGTSEYETQVIIKSILLDNKIELSSDYKRAIEKKSLLSLEDEIVPWDEDLKKDILAGLSGDDFLL